jgi:hypothetical protein
MAVTICYPTAGANVPGNGGLFSWGTVTPDDQVTGAYAQWQAADDAPVRVDGVPVTAPAPCDWAFAFSNLAVGPNITMYVVANSGEYPVTFTCLGHGA